MKAEKQIEKIEVTIDDYTFYCAPFPAMTSARISGDLSAVLGPVISGILPLLDAVSGDDESFLDKDFAEVAPALSGAFSALSGDKVEKLLKELLIDHRNVSFNSVNDETVAWLDLSAFNEIFCKDIMGAYRLAFEVIKLNFGDFFTKLTTLFGSRTDGKAEKTQKITVI